MPDEKKVENSTNTGSERPESIPLEDRNWGRESLKRKFSDRNVESLFWKYGFRLHRGYFLMFLVAHTILVLVHIAFLIIYNTDRLSTVLMDILGYLGTGIVLALLTVTIFKKDLNKGKIWLPHFASALGIACIVVTDIALQIYHSASFHSRSSLRPAYSTHSIIASHIFFPKNDNITSIILGTTVSVLYIVDLLFVTYRSSDNNFQQIAADAIFFICLNLLGQYFRYMNDIFIRSGFLDKRACVESTLKLNYEKETEEQLMLSILPRHLASRVQEDLRKKSVFYPKEKRILNNPYKEFYIERHNDVSILYADIVNYTKMTSSLPANRLVEILNELFGRFDEASEKHKVLRIKFLGDCYYCVSGVPQPNPYHAKCCVDLALEMIQIIKVVREANDLNIDMRIGIHSGSILSGILGKCKWQYDIWSKDVIIANRMEQSGRSGMVHITKQTLDKLGTLYNVEPGYGHLNDELLAKCNIETFFVIPKITKQTDIIPDTGMHTSIIWRIPSKEQEKNKDNFDEDDCTLRRRGTDAMFGLKRPVSGCGHLLLSGRRGESDTVKNRQTSKMADTSMEKDIEMLPYGELNSTFQKKKIRFFHLIFDDKGQLEKPYFHQPDPLFRFYIATALFVFLCIVCIQCVLPLRWSYFSFVIYGVSALVLIFLLPLTWTHFGWKNLSCNRYREHIPLPNNAILKFLYNVSVQVIRSVFVRMGIYIGVSVILAISLLAKLLEITLKPYVSDSELEEFVGPWQMTEGCSLTVLMCFLFFRIHFQLKLAISAAISALYIYCIYNFKSIFDQSDTWNPGVPSRIAHMLSILFLVLELHLIDRQTELISRLDYCWKKQLLEEREAVKSTSAINKNLLQNILPVHVAEIYLNADRSLNELYHENYDHVSVMFASLTNYSLYNELDTDLQDTESHSLRILNRIICDFDDALLEESKRIEKIKVAGWTYMAACGLAPGTTLNVSDTCDVNILTIVKFATRMMRILKNINDENSTNFGLRVGVSHGPVTAGVVGSQRPYYDIWGNTVNVASRMDSTGEAWKIQIPQQTADILKQEGVQCDYRGTTFVKGKGDMETFYVRLSQDFFLTKD